PGTFNGGIHIGGHVSLVTLAPGLYFINGGFSVAPQVSVVGTGVTIFVAKGAIQVKGSMNIKAPTAGTYKGVAIFQGPRNKAAISISGDLVLSGVFYAPAAV